MKNRPASLLHSMATSETRSQEREAADRLDSACSSGRRLLGSVYVHRSVARAVSNAGNVDCVIKFCRSLCLLFEDEFSLFQELYEFHGTLLAEIRLAVGVLAQTEHGVTLSGVAFSLARAFALVHLLDVVKDRKVSLALDCQLYESALQKVVASTGNQDAELAHWSTRLENCQTVREFVTMPWSILNELLQALSDVPHAATVLAHLTDFINRTLQGGGDVFAPYVLAHQRYPLLQALPIVLYLHSFLNRQSPLDEGLTPRQIELCSKLLRKHPVVPGIGDLPVVLAEPLRRVQAGKDFKKQWAVPLEELDKKGLQRLDGQFSLRLGLRESREVHDFLCEGFVHLLREAEKTKQEPTQPVQVCEGALEVSLRALEHLSSWHCKVLNLYAWRKARPTTGDETDREHSIKTFEPEDLPMVLEIMSCIRGLAGLFRRAWGVLFPLLQEKSRRVCRKYLAHFLRKPRQSVDGKIQELVGNLQKSSKRLFVGESREQGFGLGSDILGDGFDPANISCLIEMRNLVEQLIHAGGSSIPRSRFGFGKNSAGLAGGVIKESRDFVKTLHMLEVALGSESQLKEIADLSGLCFREMDYDAHGLMLDLPFEGVPLMLANAALDSAYGVCMDSVLTAIGIYEDGSQKALQDFRVQHIYLEIREEALKALDRALDGVVQRAIADFRVRACRNVLGRFHCDATPLSSEKIHRRYNVLFRMGSIRLAGCHVDVNAILVQKVNETLSSAFQEAVQLMDEPSTPSIVLSVGKSVQILRHVHSLLAQHLPLGSWTDIFTPDATGPTSRFLSSSILNGLLVNFHFHTFSIEFLGFQITSSMQSSNPGSSPVVRATGKNFGMDHVRSLAMLLRWDGVERLVQIILKWISDQLDSEIMMGSLKGVLDILDSSDVVEPGGVKFKDLLSSIVRSLHQFKTEHKIWREPLARMEAVGNAIAFLQMMDTVVGSKVSFSIGEESMSVIRQSGELLLCQEAVDQLKATQSGGGSSDESESFASRGIRVIQESLREWSGFPESSEWMHRLHYSISVLFFMWGAYGSENEFQDGTVGDGMVWASRIIVGLLGQDTDWEACNWASRLNHASSLETLLGNPISVDVREFQSRITQWVAVWNHVSLIVSVMDRVKEQSNSGVECQEDPPLIGFFGDAGGQGASKLPMPPTKFNSPSPVSYYGHRGSAKSGFSNDSDGSHDKLHSRAAKRAASTEPYRRKVGTGTTSALLSPRFTRRTHKGLHNHKKLQNIKRRYGYDEP
ncbi:hypothetical protein BSKO_00168 [Bryopsis sp. KO-2023]|nr:hypothetical protein BSKO_00168 [Bryopsis sp. KO-2023]